MRDVGERLRDILEAIEKIERQAEKGRSVFEQDELVQVWIIHHLQIIGEAAGKVDEEFRIDHPNIPWAQIVAMRNILVHEYFGVDPDEVWQAVERDLPALKRDLRALLSRQFPEDT